MIFILSLSLALTLISCIVPLSVYLSVCLNHSFFLSQCLYLAFFVLFLCLLTSLESILYRFPIAAKEKINKTLEISRFGITHSLKLTHTPTHLCGSNLMIYYRCILMVPIQSSANVLNAMDFLNCVFFFLRPSLYVNFWLVKLVYSGIFLHMFLTLSTHSTPIDQIICFFVFD